MINNERPQQLTQEIKQQLNSKMNGTERLPPLIRHPPRPETNVMPNLFKTIAIEGYGTEDKKVELIYSLGPVIGTGAFGTVYTSILHQFKDKKVAIKQVLQDKRYRNRELPLMRSLRHCNIVTLLYFFYQNCKSAPNQKGEVLNLVMEYMPESVSVLTSKMKKQRMGVPILTIKLCMYQIFRALSYLHLKGICHRDIKPNNLLFDSKTGVLKVCDFGSAKHLVNGERNVSYICARYYRAPELLFGATDYTNMIDIWSVGVVFSELLTGEGLFYGDSGIDQLVMIISKLGTPTKDEIQELNPNYVKYDFPEISAQPMQSLFKANTPSEAIDLLTKIFQYKPTQRIDALHACAHPFFDELREPGKKWSPDPFAINKSRELPPLFDFTEQELNIDPRLKSILVPNHFQRLVGDGSTACQLPTLTHI